MRRLILLALAAALPLTYVGRAAADDDPKAVITKAIDAMGGKDLLDKFKASKSKTKGTISILGMDAEFTADAVSQMPDKMKTTIKMELMGNAVTVEQKMVGDKATIMFNGMEIPIPDGQKAELKNAVLQQKILMLTPLLGKEFELKSIAGVKVNDKDTVGVAVTGKDVKETKLFFDKGTGLLSKIERMGVSPMGDGEVKQEILLSDYKEIQGMKRPHKTVLNNDGKKFMESTTTEQKFMEKLDDKEFSD